MLNLSALKKKTDELKLKFDQSKLGVFSNTITGIPKTIVNVIPGTRAINQSINTRSLTPIKSHLSKVASNLPQGNLLTNTNGKLTLNKQEAERTTNFVGNFTGATGSLGDDIVRIAKNTVQSKITPILKRIGVADDLIEGASKFFSKVNTPEEVSRILNMELVPKSPKLALLVKQEAQQTRPQLAEIFETKPVTIAPKVGSEYKGGQFNPLLDSQGGLGLTNGVVKGSLINPKIQGFVSGIETRIPNAEYIKNASPEELAKIRDEMQTLRNEVKNKQLPNLTSEGIATGAQQSKISNAENVVWDKLSKRIDDRINLAEDYTSSRLWNQFKISEGDYPKSPLTLNPRNYKSAEEFVKAQGETVFRAGEKGNFFSESKEYVVEGGFKGNIREAVLPKSQKIFDASKGTMELNKFATPKELKVLNGHPTDADLRVIWNDILERNGYAGMKFLDELENGKTFKTTFLTDSAKDSLKTKSQLTEIWNKANTETIKTGEKPKIRQMKTSREIPSLEATAQEQMRTEKAPVAKTEIDAGNKESPKTQEDVVSYNQDNIQESKINEEVKDAVIKKDKTNTVKDASTPPKEPETDLLTTRKFKQTDEWKDFAKYAEEHLQDKDINPAILFRHTSMTMERVAEFLDGGIGGRTYREIVKPVYDSARKLTEEGNAIKNEVENFRVLEGSTADRDASLFAQKKIGDASQKAKDLAKYTRDKYDEYLERLNGIRAKIGVEPIPKRQDYITHINEINVLSELFGGMERISVKKHISNLKSELLDAHPDWSDARAFDAAKRKVEGLTGVAQYVDARQPIFKFAKKRLGEYEADPSVIRSFNAYSQNALRYIYQAENVARNKAFKDVLPANAREFARLWNTEQVAGRQPPSFLNPLARRVLGAIKGTLGSNTILGNLGTTMMQLTSWPQVVALAGVKNTFYGLGSRLRTYIPKLSNPYDFSRTKVLRDIDIDLGLGDSLLDQMLIKIGKHDAVRNPAARARQAIDVGRNLLMGIMQTADQFTVGATYQAFYRKGVLDGLEPQKAAEFADIMVGKTQANYFKEALPPFLNTIEGKTFGQFGTYGMNQWEMFKRDFGKDFKLDEKNPKSVARLFKQFIAFLATAYMMDWASEETFGKQPFNVKNLIDDSVGFAKGEVTGGQIFDTSKDTVASYLPFMGSVKYGSMPPVLEFGKDVIGATLGTGKNQEDAIANLSEKWIYNILLPYGGNQLRKSLQGVEASTKVDLPFVRNTSKNIDIKDIIDKAKAILFGPYSTKEAITYFEQTDRREGIKEKLKITGTITSDENIAKLKSMTKEEFEIYTASYATSTLKTIQRKMDKSAPAKPSLDNIFAPTKPSLETIFK